MSENSKPSVFGRINNTITATRNITLNLLFLLILFVIVAVWVSSCQGTQPPARGALIVNPAGVIVDRARTPDPIAQLLSGPLANTTTAETELGSLLKAIESASQDNNITHLVLDFDELLWAAPAHAERIGKAILAFKESGKPVLAYGYFFDQSSYQMASFADALYLHPQGQVTLAGFGNSSLYFEEFLNKYDVNVHVFRVGEFKSAVEPFTRKDMSPEARMANAALYDNLWQHTLTTIATNRGLGTERVEDFSKNFHQAVEQTQGDMARVALEFHLVDELLTSDQARVRLGEAVGFADDGEIQGVGFRSYLKATQPDPTSLLTQNDSQIAVLTTQGIITNANHNEGIVGAQATIELIRSAIRNPKVKALVVRVDSPGGSQFASELIRAELELAQLSGKPVVASFGANAASGGYWIAATSNHIVAERTTITGSIGIFALTTTFENTLQNLGIYTDGVGTTPFSQGIGPFSGLNEEISRVLQAQVEHGYRQFIELVARGRKLDLAQVESMAQGRVWSGEVAEELGLVDSIGGLHEAISEAASLAELTDYQTVYLSEPEDPRTLLLNALFDDSLAQLFNHQPHGVEPSSNQARYGVTSMQSRSNTLRDVLAPLQQGITLLQNLSDPKAIYSLCETCAFSPSVFTSTNATTPLQSSNLRSLLQ